MADGISIAQTCAAAIARRSFADRWPDDAALEADMMMQTVAGAPSNHAIRETFSEQLDDLHTRLLDGDDAAAFPDLCALLSERREQFDGVAWRAFINRVCLSHPISRMVHREPMTAHSFAAPRGYHGDAELLDYAYRLHAVNTRDAGAAALYEAIAECPAPRAVRARRKTLAAFVDDTAATTPNARILAVAAGHLREARLSAAVQDDAVGDYVALDQDACSLAELARDPCCRRVQTIAASVRDVITGAFDAGEFDGIYAAGLYDYLRPHTARRLTTTLFEQLRPGGRLLVANFLQGLSCAGYMEAYMDWFLIYRTPEQMWALASGIPREQIAEQRQFVEENGNITFLELRKR